MVSMNYMQIGPHKSILILDDEFDIAGILKQGIDKRGFRAFLSCMVNNSYLALNSLMGRMIVALS
jgi:ActR/RegA family two-component response regulator